MSSSLDPQNITNSTDLVTLHIPRSTRDTIKVLANEQGVSFGNVVAQQFARQQVIGAPMEPQPSGTVGPLNRGSGKEQGVVFISNVGTIYKSPAITCQTIREMLQNPYIVSKMEKRAITYFPNRVVIEALNPNQEVDPKVTKRLQNMCEVEDVRLSDRIIQGDHDAYSYGLSIFNPIWVRKGGEIYLAKMRHLPAWSFATRPIRIYSSLIWSPILQGIFLGEDGLPQYWQRISPVSLIFEQITNNLLIKNPKDEMLAGDSRLVPLAEVIEMIKYCWNTEFQALHMAGAPVIFLKITNPRDSDDPITGGVGDIEYGQLLLKSRSKDKQFILRDNMEVITIPNDVGKDPLTTERALKLIIDDYFSVVDQLSRDEPNLGGNGVPKLKVLIQAIKGLHNWVLAPFENELNKYFPLNGYPEGWNVRLTIEVWNEDETDVKLREAEIGFAAKVLDGDEIRELLPHVQPADKKKWEQINAFYQNLNALGGPEKAMSFTKHIHTEDSVIQEPIKYN